MVFARIHGIGMESCFLKGIMVSTWTHGIDSNHGIDSDSWYRIATPESHTHKRAKFYPYAKLAGVCLTTG